MTQNSPHPIASGGKPPLIVILAAPRGFCAGVDRAIQIVEIALERFGAPIYVRHEIVHNRHVVNRLANRGAVFVDTLDEVPAGGRVVFSAHGVPKSVPEEARARRLFFVDATCPLVFKVHMEAMRHHGAGRHVILIGHAGHPEVTGTMGQLPDGAMTLIEDSAAVAHLPFSASDPLAYVTQTTLSVDDTAVIISALRQRFPDIARPRREDICYATSNRQNAVKHIAPHADVFLVVGSPNSSNAQRLVDVAKQAGCQHTYLTHDVASLRRSWFRNATRIGITAGASTPEILVTDMIRALRDWFDITVEERQIAEETIRFKLPSILTRQDSTDGCLH